MTQYNLIALCGNLSRVYEISKLGNHTVKLVAGKNVTGTISTDDVSLLNSFYGFENVENADMIIEVCFGLADILNTLNKNTRFETIEAVNARIAKADLQEIQVDETIKGSAELLLKNAIVTLQFSFCEVIAVVGVAATIAKLVGSNEIKPEHIAEAIQYKSIRP